MKDFQYAVAKPLEQQLAYPDLEREYLKPYVL